MIKSRYILFLLMVVVGACLTMTAYTATAKTVYVDDDNIGGSNGTLADPVPFIEMAVDLAGDNDTIFVYDGDYNETVYINRTIFNGSNLEIRGESESGVVLNGDDSYGFVFEGINISLTNFTIELSSTGIVAIDCSGSISDVTIRPGLDTGPVRSGFSLEGCDGLHIDGLTVSDLMSMGQIGNSKRCTISNSSSDYVSADVPRGGITLDNSWGCIIENTTIESNHTFGLAVSGRYDNVLRRSLVINGENTYYYYDLHGTAGDYEEITGLILLRDQISTIGKITLANSSYVSVFDNDLNNQPFGSCIVLWNCENIDVGNNSFNRDSTSVGDSGLAAIECSDIYAHNFTTQAVYSGVRLIDTVDSYLFNVTCINNEWGIRVEGGGDNWMNWSRFSFNNQAGIALIDTERNRVTETNMSSNKKYGYYIEGNYDNFLATSNTVNLEPVHYYNNRGSGLTIDSLTLTANDVSNVGKVTLYNSRNVKVTGCNLRNNGGGSGIFIVESRNITVSDNSMNNNLRGISLVDSRLCHLDGNDMDSDEYGLYIKGNYDNWINMSNRANGESIHYFFRNDSIDVSGAVLTKKRVSNVGKITIVDSTWATVDVCRLENGTSGVLIVESSVNVTSSTLKNNRNGVTLDSGSAIVDDCDVISNRIGIPAEGEIIVTWNRIDANEIGVLCANSSTVENNTLDDNINGIVIVGMENLVAFNTVTNSSSSGIDVDGDDNSVRNNTCNENKYGIFIRGGVDIGVNGNRLRNNDRFGIRLKGDPRNLDVSDNTAFGNGYKHLTGAGILITGARDITLGRNVLYSNNFADIMVTQSDNVTVDGCVLNGTYEGFDIYESSNITISNCTIRDSDSSVLILESVDIIIRDNEISDARPFGVWSRFSRGIVIEDNEIVSNHTAIQITGGRGAVIRGNDLSAPKSIAIASSRENTVLQNVFDGDIGVEIRSGASFTVIKDCNLSGPSTAVSIVDSNGTVIRNCTFSGNAIAVNMFEAYGGRVEDCDFYGIDVPVHINESDRNVIVDCSFIGAGTAILIEEGVRNIVKRAVFERMGEAFTCIGGFMNSLQSTDATGADVPANLSDDSEAFFLNVTYNEADREISDTSILHVNNWLRIRVLFFDLTPIEGADAYCLQDSDHRYRTNGYGGFDPDTNGSGETWWFQVAYKIYNSTSVVTPDVTANATFQYWEDSRTVDMSTSHVEEFISDIAPPNLKWTNETDFIDTGVYPAMGNTSQVFEFRVIYTDPNGDAPLNGTPVLWIDVDNDREYKSSFSYVDGTFTEGGFNMSKVGSSTDYSSGVIYNFSTRLPVSHTIRYKFTAFDVNNLHAIRWVPVERQKGPVVLSADIDIRTVRFEELMTEVHFTYQLSNGTYITDLDNSTARLWEDGYRDIEIWEPDMRNITLMMDWSNSMPSEMRSMVADWMTPFLENLTGMEAVEVIKYSTDVFHLSDFNTSVEVISDAINTSVSSGSEAHLYDAIDRYGLDGIRQHMVIVAFGPNYASNPKQHVQYEELIGDISAGTTVHVVAHGPWDWAELLQIAIETQGRFIAVDDDALPGALVEILAGIQNEIVLTYDASIHYDGSPHECVLNASHLMIEASVEFEYSEPITPPPFVNISAPGGWWTTPSLPVNITIEGEITELTVQMMRGELSGGIVGNWTEWTNVTVTDGFLDGMLTGGAYRLRVKGSSISGDSHGWVNETNGNVTLVDVTPPALDAAVPDSPSWDVSQLVLSVGNASDLESNITSLNVSVAFGSGTPIDAYTVPWDGQGYQVILKQREWHSAVYNITLTVTNGAGLTDAVYAVIVLDDSVPTVGLTAPTNWTIQDWAHVQAISVGNVSNVTLQVASAVVGTVLDPSSATWTTLRVEDDGEIWSYFNFTHNATLMHARQYMFRAQGTNSQTGQIGPWNITDVLMVDTVPPEEEQLTLTGDREGLFISFIASDDGSGMAGYSYIVYRGAGTFATGSGTTDGTETIEVAGPIGVGNYRAVVTFSDVAGGVSEPESTGFLTITDGPPTVPELVSPADGAVVGMPPTLIWNASIEPDGDDVSYLLVVNGPTGENVRITIAATSYALGTLPLGDYTWSVSSTDGTYASEAAVADFTYGLPDLEPMFMFYSDSSVTYMEFPGSITVAATIENVGPIDSPAVNVTFTLDGETVRTVQLTGVAADSAETISFSVDLDIGTHTMVMEVDPDDMIPEQDDGNNTFSLEITVGEEPEKEKVSDEGSLMPIIGGIILVAVLAVLLLVLLKLRKGGIKGKGSAPAKKKAAQGPKMMDASEYDKLKEEFAGPETGGDAVWKKGPKKK